MQLDVTGYSGSYGHLNGRSVARLTRLDFLRSLLTVGYRGPHVARAKLGRWRHVQLLAMVKGNLRPSMATTNSFANLESSEVVGVSYLFGQAFGHWFAQRKMDVPVALHLTPKMAKRWKKSGSAILKSGASLPKPNSRPDLIGLKKRERHVFECKGGQSYPTQTKISDALGQASAINLINGKSPTTRCASFLVLESPASHGLVIDPPGDPSGFAIEFNEFEALQAAYATVLEQRLVKVPLPRRVDREFVGTQIVDDIWICLDLRVATMFWEAKAANLPQEVAAETVLSRLSEWTDDYRHSNGANLSIGPDGIALFDPRGVVGDRTNRTPRWYG